MARDSRGDTIIEVMLAMSLLTAILFTSWSIVNRSTQISAAARQRTVMVNGIKEQAEIIKSFYASNKTAVTNAKKFGDTTYQVSIQNNVKPNPCDTPSPVNAYSFSSTNGTVTLDSSLKENASYAGSKIWFQAVDSSEGYIDFYVRSCWLTQGKENQDNSQVIVRLNK